MVELNVIEHAHRQNIEKLVDEFSGIHPDKIMGLYNSLREAEDSKAKITDFTPIFTYRMVREALKEEYRIASPY